MSSALLIYLTSRTFNDQTAKLPSEKESFSLFFIQQTFTLRQSLSLDSNSLPSHHVQRLTLELAPDSASSSYSMFGESYQNLQQLRSLDLHNNEIWGDVGEIFTELKNVEFVDLSCNRLHGGLSLSMDNISSISNTLRHLNLSHNALNGKFFSDDTIGSF